MNANFGLIDELSDPPRDKVVKRERYAARALTDLQTWAEAHRVPFRVPEAVRPDTSPQDVR